MELSRMGGVLVLALLFGTGAAYAGPVNINQAGTDELALELLGIGEARAKAIVEYRQTHGPFRSADELANVEGVGPHIVDINRENIRVTSTKTKSSD